MKLRFNLFRIFLKQRFQPIIEYVLTDPLVAFAIQVKTVGGVLLREPFGLWVSSCGEQIHECYASFLCFRADHSVKVESGGDQFAIQPVVEQRQADSHRNARIRTHRPTGEGK